MQLKKQIILDCHVIIKHHSFFRQNMHVKLKKRERKYFSQNVHIILDLFIDFFEHPKLYFGVDIFK